MQPVKVASKMLYETIAVSLNAHLLTSALLAARGISHSHAHMLTCFAFFPTDFRGKERLLAVYSFGSV